MWNSTQMHNLLIQLYFFLQCPYLIYVEVLETEDILTGPVPVRIPESGLRPSHSDEDFCPSPTVYEEGRGGPMYAPHPLIPLSTESGDVIDDGDCWSQDDDDIITVR